MGLSNSRPAMERCSGAAGVLSRWRALVLVAALLLLGSVPAAWTQSGSLNIDCGATSRYVDSTTGLTWEPDAPYISSGKIQTLSLPTSLQSFTEMRTLRYFDDARVKNCFALPVADNITYMLKLTFFYGNYDNANLPPEFKVSVDANIVSNVTVDAAAPSYTEYTYMSRGNVTYVCVLRTSPGATPFISGISVKMAENLAFGYRTLFDDYLHDGKMMITRNRVNYGGTSLIRAPSDYYDRFWFPEGSSSFYYLTPQIVEYEFLSTSSPVPSFVGKSWGPPSSVLQTAVCTTSGTVRTYLLPPRSPVIDASIVYYAFYFVELNSSLYPPLRNFTLEVPELRSGEYDRIHDMYGISFLEYGTEQIVLSDEILNTTTTVILRPNYSDTGPILNAMEVFTRSEDRIAKSDARDALAIEDIKKDLNLTEWTGDPCLPFPHAWVTCSIPDPTSSDVEPLITAMNLSGHHLVGSLPASVGNLTDLTSLDLSNNGLSGPLPEWLTLMTELRLLAVQNNNFSGPIPKGLRSANLQTFTYYGNPLLGDNPAPVSGGKSNSSGGKSNIAIIAGASAGGVVGLAFITVIAILVYCRCKRNPQLPDEVPGVPTSVPERQKPRIVTPGGAKAYTFAEVTAATAQFKRLLGRGGFGPVYYGKLLDGQEVAVKVADGTSKHEEREFFNEVDVLSRVHHKNLVALVGYCQDQKQILIYEYMPNGSLFDHLHGSSMSTGILDWRMRLHVALNAAQGLEYLHSGCRPSVIHRDVKSSNILLTPQFEAKVADFGLTKLMGDTDATRVMTNNIMGTAGYLDPEYYKSHYISAKSDVYSFGIVLLELITGCLPIEKSSPNGRNPNIGNWVRESLHNNDINSILDPAVAKSNPSMETVWKVADIAMQCVEPEGVHRPTMTEVVHELQSALAMEAAKVPSTQAPTLRSQQPSGLPGDSSGAKVPAAMHFWHPSGSSDQSSGSNGPTSFPTAR